MGTKIRKIGIPLQTQFFYIHVEFKGVYISRTRFPAYLEGASNSGLMESKLKQNTWLPEYYPYTFQNVIGPLLNFSSDFLILQSAYKMTDLKVG